MAEAVVKRLVGRKLADVRDETRAREVVRRILIENARRKHSLKRGGDRQQINLEDAVSVVPGPQENLLALDEALGRLEVTDPVAAKLVKLRYFAGLTMPEVAETLEIPLRQAERNWTYARTWLHRELSPGDGADAEGRARP